MIEVIRGSPVDVFNPIFPAIYLNVSTLQSSACKNTHRYHKLPILFSNVTEEWVIILPSKFLLSKTDSNNTFTSTSRWNSIPCMTLVSCIFLCQIPINLTELDLPLHHTNLLMFSCLLSSVQINCSEREWPLPGEIPGESRLGGSLSSTGGILQRAPCISALESETVSWV